MAAELEAVKALRVEAAAAVAEVKLAMAKQADLAEVRIPRFPAEARDRSYRAQSSSALKRKRDDEEADEARVVCTREHCAPLPKRHRTMQVVSTIAHTTTIAAFGAVAAWTALAFS